MSISESPQFVVPEENLIPVHSYPSTLYEIPPSRMFLIKKSLAKYTQKMGEGAVIFDASQGDGGASLPGVPLDVLDAAHEIVKAHGTGYDNPYGADEFRKAIVEDYWHLDAAVGWGPNNVTAVVGGRDGLIKAYEAMIHLGTCRIGDVVLLTRVPWVSYNWGPYAIGANVLLAPGDEAAGWQFTEEAITESVEFCRTHGNRRIAGIIITSPDNPTGHTIPVERQIALGKHALAAGVPFVLYDWIYHYINETGPMDANAMLGAFTPEERRRVIILDGLTKSLGASNVRNGHLLADADVIKLINSRASHGVIPGFHGQAIAIAASRMGYAKAAATIIEPTNESRRIVRKFLTENGYRFIMGDGGYYAFVYVGNWMEAAGMADSFALIEYLAGEHGVAVVPGVAFSEAGNHWIRFSYALPPAKTAGALQRFHAGLQALGK